MVTFYLHSYSPLPTVFDPATRDNIQDVFENWYKYLKHFYLEVRYL